MRLSPSDVVTFEAESVAERALREENSKLRAQIAELKIYQDQVARQRAHEACTSIRRSFCEVLADELGLDTAKSHDMSDLLSTVRTQSRALASIAAQLSTIGGKA